MKKLNDEIKGFDEWLQDEPWEKDNDDSHLDDYDEDEPEVERDERG